MNHGVRVFLWFDLANTTLGVLFVLRYLGWASYPRLEKRGRDQDVIRLVVLGALVVWIAVLLFR